MKHEYRCTFIDSKCGINGIFYTNFEPQFDEHIAYCPCCGNSEFVQYLGKVEADLSRFDKINNLLAVLSDIRKGSVKYGLSDLSDWLDHDLDKILVELDELRYEVENG